MLSLEGVWDKADRSPATALGFRWPAGGHTVLFPTHLAPSLHLCAFMLKHPCPGLSKGLGAVRTPGAKVVRALLSSGKNRATERSGARASVWGGGISLGNW